MKNQVFNTFWHGPELSPLHWACVKSFADRGHRLRVFAYQPVNLPPGVVREDARQVLPESELFEFHRSFSAFSNIFRYKLLLEQGGWWVDTDVYCLKEDIDDCSYAWAAQDDEIINGAILKFPSGDATLRGILAAAQEIGSNVKVWGEIGPALLTRHLAGREFEGHYGSTQDFYPLHWIETHLLWLPNCSGVVKARCAGSAFLHLWASMARQFGIDIYSPAPEGSVLRWMAQHCDHPAGWAPMDEAAEARTMNAIKAFLTTPWVWEKWKHLFGTNPSLPA